MAHNSGGPDYQEFSHIVPPIRFVAIEGVGAATPVAVPGAEDGDVLLGLIAIGDAPPQNLLSDAVFADGEISFPVLDLTGSFLAILYWDQNGVMT